MSRILESMLDGVKSVAILGHIRPDGDCLGSTLGLYNYCLLYTSGVAGYVDRIGTKYAAKWGVQMVGMNFQTHPRTAAGIRTSTRDRSECFSESS